MFSWLLFNSLCALPLAVLALAARRWQRSASFEHLLWVLVLVRLVLPPLSWGDPAPALGAGPVLVSSGEPSLGDELVAGLTRTLGSNWSIHAGRMGLAFFLITLAWVVLRELARARAVDGCVRRSRAAPPDLERRVLLLARELGVRAPRLRLSAEAGGPFLWSLRRPVLVIPDEGAPPAPTVLAHEFAHLLRRDHWTAWLELLVQAFHFWNPLFWLARRRLRAAAEQACDFWVVERFPAERRTFAEALIETAERASGAFVPRAVQAIGQADAEPREFEERLRLILMGHGSAWFGRFRSAALAGALLLSAITLPGLAAPTLGDFRRSLPDLPAGIDRTLWMERLERAEAQERAAPDDGEAQHALGIAYLGLGRTAEALAAFERREELGFQPEKALYNQACAHTRQGDLESALACLHRAAGSLPVADMAARDPDLEPLRAHPGFAALSGP